MRLLRYIFLPLVLVAVAAHQASGADVVVVMSSDAEIYQSALEGFRESVRHRIVSVYNMRENIGAGRNELAKIRAARNPELILAVGTPALRVAATEKAEIPVIHTMVFNPFGVVDPAAKNVTGVTMNPSANQVVSLVRELNPSFRRIGIIYDPSRSGRLILQSGKAAQNEGLQLVTREISSAGDIGTALKSFQREIDVLWIWPDEMFLADEILQRVFLFSFESKIPVLGLSKRQTEMGALLSLSYGSAKDMGRQAGEAVNRLLDDSKPCRRNRRVDSCKTRTVCSRVLLAVTRDTSSISHPLHRPGLAARGKSSHGSKSDATFLVVYV